MRIDDERQSSGSTDDRASGRAAVTNSKPKRWPVVLSVIIFLFLGAASLGLALFGGASYTDSYSHEADRLWAILAMIDAGIIFSASIAAFLFLFRRSETIWKATILLLVLSLAGDGVLIWAGFGMLADAKRRGGDWAGLSVAGSLILGIVCPALIGVAAFAGGACLSAARSSRRMAIAENEKGDS
ncbi:MAG TPA: hypothetical protein VKX17_28135 [Planctomycetota bacterium]|nr:hypothetical protein [Planctomycetota bacterium]